MHDVLMTRRKHGLTCAFYLYSTQSVTCTESVQKKKTYTSRFVVDTVDNGSLDKGGPWKNKAKVANGASL